MREADVEASGNAGGDAGDGRATESRSVRSLIGYARVSTAEGAQVLDRPLDALAAAVCARVFED